MKRASDCSRTQSRTDTPGKFLPNVMARAVACALAASGVPAAWSAPVGEQVVAGQAAISQSGSNTLIQQTTGRVAINWQSFNIGAAEGVRFAQPSASSIALNRVL